MLPLTRTKAGPGEKEPAFIVLRTHVCKFIFILLMTGVLVGLKVYDSESSLEMVKTRLHGIANHLHTSEHEHSRAHAEMAKVGEELETHLERDLHELELGQKLMHTLRETQVAYEAEVGTLVSDVFRLARETVDTDAGNMRAGLDEVHAALTSRLAAASAALFERQTATVGALVKRLAAGAKEASERREELHSEIIHSLHETAEHSGDHEGLSDDPEEWWSGESGGDPDSGEDDHWATDTEKWHNTTGERPSPEARGPSWVDLRLMLTSAVHVRCPWSHPLVPQ